MNISIVGGNFGNTPKESKIISKIDGLFKDLLLKNDESEFNITTINGGNMIDLPSELYGDLNIWMPNIDNEEEKHYPKKKQGSVLICSKIIREGYTPMDAISRIFKMNGNAVIAIYSDTKPFKFVLYDALGNTWYSGYDVDILITMIYKLYVWTKQSIRVNTKYNSSLIKPEHPHLAKLIEINNKLANHVQLSCGERFFGNISTRCQKLFPSVNDKLGMYVSPRNVDKSALTPEDMVYINSNMEYVGDKKPSVDSPVQLKIYQKYPHIHYMIHGHARIIGITETNNYRPCGDVNEADEVQDIANHKTWAINLKNHGFLIYADTIEHLEEIVDFFVKHGSFTYARGNID